VESHDGLVDVYSEPGKGTTFKVYLPATETSSAAHNEQVEEANLPRGHGETILLIDDEISILTITGQTLQTYGYRVLTASDGAEGVAAYAQHKNDIAIILTDMMMPVMDGTSTIRAVKRMNPAVKILAASGLKANGEAAEASGAGPDRFLTKPYTAGTLLKALREVLTKPSLESGQPLAALGRIEQPGDGAENHNKLGAQKVHRRDHDHGEHCQNQGIFNQSLPRLRDARTRQGLRQTLKCEATGIPFKLTLHQW